MEFEDKLVRQFVDKILVLDETIEVTFQTGTSVRMNEEQPSDKEFSRLLPLLDHKSKLFGYKTMPNSLPIAIDH